MHFRVFSAGQSQMCMKQAWNRAVFFKKFNVTHWLLVHANMRITNHKKFLPNAFFLKKYSLHPELPFPTFYIYLHTLRFTHFNELLDIVISQVPISVCIQHLPGTEQDAKGSLRMHPFQTPLASSSWIEAAQRSAVQTHSCPANGVRTSSSNNGLVLSRVKCL